MCLRYGKSYVYKAVTHGNLSLASRQTLKSCGHIQKKKKKNNQLKTTDVLGWARSTDHPTTLKSSSELVGVSFLLHEDSYCRARRSGRSGNNLTLTCVILSLFVCWPWAALIDAPFSWTWTSNLPPFFRLHTYLRPARLASSSDLRHFVTSLNLAKFRDFEESYETSSPEPNRPLAARCRCPSLRDVPNSCR
jgi:hypothetical protein